jgi:hypothetical protein
MSATVVDFDSALEKRLQRNYLRALLPLSQWSALDSSLRHQGVPDSAEHLQEGLQVLECVHRVITQTLQAYDQVVKKLQRAGAERQAAPLAAVHDRRQRFAQTWAFLDARAEEIRKRMSGW